MADAGTLARHLATLDEPALIRLLERRPHVLAGVAPRSLADLAERLWHAYALNEAIKQLSAGHLHVLQAAVSLGDLAPVSALGRLLDGAGPDHDAVVGRFVQELVDAALLVVDDGRLALPDALREMVPDPFHLGQPLVALLPTLTADRLRRIVTALGLPRATKRAELGATLVEFYLEPDNVNALIASAPTMVRTYLTELMDAPVMDGELRDVAPYQRFGIDTGQSLTYQQQRQAEEWAGDRALIVQPPYGFGVQVPSEVGRALRGPGFRAPFQPHPPALPTRPVDPETVQAASAAAASLWLGQLLTVLDHVARHPLAALKSGGVGAREITKLAKSSGVDEPAIRLALECAADLGLLEHTPTAVGTSAAFAAWRAREPAEQVAAVLQGWWAMGANPTESRDADGKALRVAAPREYCTGCETARTALIGELAQLPPDVAVQRADLARLMRWRHPFAHIAPDDGADPFATQWREAELLGLIATGALTALGRGLRGSPEELIAAARAALPAVADQATFGSDLTAYAVGAPSARITALLDAAADRESGGAAITWRFSPASVRRAFDDGVQPAQLLAELTDIAGRELPQPLRYLIDDIARRHGHLRVSPANTCISSDDHALLAEVAADRKLAKFGLRLLAPTVLVAEADPDTVLAALRAAGYLPVGNAPAATGAAKPPRPMSMGTAPQAPRRRQARAAPHRDPAAVAAALLGAPAAGAPDDSTATEQSLLALRPRLSGAEVRQLADAIDHHGRVLIEYRAQSGGYTQRVIADPELVGDVVYAWCELRSAERYFVVSSILSIAAV